MSRGTTTAALVETYGADLRIAEVPLPSLEDGALLVSVDTATVCGSDVHAWQGAYGSEDGSELPLMLGHEIVGRVIETTRGAEFDSLGHRLEIGDRVVWEHAACGRCRRCTVDRQPTLCTRRRIGMFHPVRDHPHIAGGFGRHSYVWPGAGRLKVPASLPSASASAASCALRTVIAAFERQRGLTPDSTVLIQGSGPLGLFAAALASWQRARRIIVVGGPEDRLALAREWGATDTISVLEHPDPVDRLQVVRTLVEDGPDTVMEMSGARTAFAEGLELAGRGAQYTVVGTLGGAVSDVAAGLVAGKGLTINGVLGGDIGTYARALSFMELAADRFDWQRMFAPTPYPLERATDALRAARQGTEIKPVLRPND